MTYAQDVQFNFGMSVGYTKSIANYDRFESVYYLYGDPTRYGYINILALVEIATPSNIRFQSGLRYFKSGWEHAIYPHPDWQYYMPPPVREGEDYHYLSIPVNLNYYLPFLSSVYLSGGIETVFVISGYSFLEVPDGDKYKTYLNDNRQNPFFMLALGVGYEFGFESVTLFVEPEYSHVIWDTSDNSFRTFGMIFEQIRINFGVKY
jgi:hypothetical protein